MKKQALILITIITGSLIFSSGCSGEDKKNGGKQPEPVKEQYQCPMKCTEEKFDKPGNCPVCGMELEKVANG
jgi:P-type Cu+ transporter